MVTYQEILNEALTLNRTTQENAQVSSGGYEITRAINRSLRGIYLIGARVNPLYHAKVDTAAESGGEWTIPADAELVFLVQDSEGETVFPTHPEEPIPDPGHPCVIRLGKTYRRPPGAAIPTGDLTLWYSRRAEVATTLGAEVDLEDDFAPLLTYDLGAWFAGRDENMGEFDRLIGMRDTYLALYVASLEHAETGLVRNVGHTSTFDTPSLVDLKELLLARG
jgi:hypothetical protein